MNYNNYNERRNYNLGHKNNNRGGYNRSRMKEWDGGENSKKNTYIKQQLIDYIYSTIELSNFRYKIIEYEHDLPLLLKNKYSVSANFSGSNCLLVFIKIKEKYYSYLIDRKTLSYNKYQVNPKNVKTISVEIKLDNSIYKGSIFDGILIQSDRTKTFVITDIYQFRGKMMLNEKIQYKIINLVSYLNANLKNDQSNNLKLTVNKIYDVDQIDKLVNDDIPNTKNINVRGIVFYPDISGTKLIFLFNNNKKSNNKNEEKINTESYENKLKIKTKYNNQNNNQNNIKHTLRFIPKIDENIYAIFEVKKTRDSDVYKLYLMEKIVNNKKTILRSKKIGIGLIPTTECSKLCRDIFSNKTIKQRILMKCKFINDKNKWQPIELDKNAKYPTLITDIEKTMTIIEESLSDEDDL